MAAPTQRTLLRWSISVALVAYIVWFLVDRRDVFADNFAGTALHMVLLGCGVVATWIVVSLQTLLPLRELGARIGFWENLLLTVAAVFGNYLPLRAGTVLRMRYIKAVHDIGYLRYGGILGIRTLLLLVSAGAVGLSAAVLMTLTGKSIRPGVFVLFVALLLISVAPFWKPVHRLLPTRGLAGRVAGEVTQAIALAQQNRPMTVAYLGLVGLEFLILTGRLAVAFDIIGQQPSPWIYCFLGPIATILTFINITPGNLGLREWIVGLLSGGLGVDYAAGLFAASVDRVIAMALAFSVGGAATVVVITRLGSGSRAGSTLQVPPVS